MEAATQATVPVVTVGTVTYATKYLGVHRNTVYNWIKKGDIRAILLVNGRYLILQDELDAIRDRRMARHK